MISFKDIKPKDYDVPLEEHTFWINKRSYYGSTYVYDKESPAFKMLDYGENFLRIFRQYYKIVYGIKLPKVKLFAIDNSSINAFAVYEKSLNSYCIGVFIGACEALYNNVHLSFEKLVGTLIPANKKDSWFFLIYIFAIRIFIAHEYSHILAGHVSTDNESFVFEMIDSDQINADNLISQMKEFQVDQMAAQDLCYMEHWHFTNRINIACAIERENFIKHFKTVFDAEQLEKLAKENEIRYRKRFNAPFYSRILESLKMIMAGINTVFYTFDSNRSRILAEFAERNNIPEVERESFFFRSGLQTIREFDHPLPSIRIDAIVRIVDECIDAFAPEGEADYWSEQVSDYSWEVEIVRNNYNLGNLYRHIAYTPTAQDFIQEMQALWEKNRDIFPAIVKPLVRLFYVNRLVHMTDDGVLI